MSQVANFDNFCILGCIAKKLSPDLSEASVSMRNYKAVLRKKSDDDETFKCISYAESICLYSDLLQKDGISNAYSNLKDVERKVCTSILLF